MSEFHINDGASRLWAHRLGADGIGVGAGFSGFGHTIRLTHDQARALAVELIKLAGSDDPEWGPLIPWHGGECPLDEWERDNSIVLVRDPKDFDDHEWYFEVPDETWTHDRRFGSVIAYRVRKRPPEPVEEWVRRTVVLGLHDVDIEILTRDGKAVDARMAQEGE